MDSTLDVSEKENKSAVERQMWTAAMRINTRVLYLAYIRTHYRHTRHTHAIGHIVVIHFFFVSSDWSFVVSHRQTHTICGSCQSAIELTEGNRTCVSAIFNFFFLLISPTFKLRCTANIEVEFTHEAYLHVVMEFICILAGMPIDLINIHFCRQPFDFVLCRRPPPPLHIQNGVVGPT